MRVELAELEQIRDAPVDALELRLAIPARGGCGHELLGDRQSLLRVIGAPERDMPGAEGLEQRATAAAATGLQRLRAHLLAQRRGRRVVDLDREPREQPGPQRRVGIDRGQCLLQPVADRVAHGPTTTLMPALPSAARASSSGSPSARAAVAASANQRSQMARRPRDRGRRRAASSTSAPGDRRRRDLRRRRARAARRRPRRQVRASPARPRATRSARISTLPRAGWHRAGGARARACGVPAQPAGAPRGLPPCGGAAARGGCSPSRPARSRESGRARSGTAPPLPTRPRVPRTRPPRGPQRPPPHAPRRLRRHP